MNKVISVVKKWWMKVVSVICAALISFLTLHPYLSVVVLASGAGAVIGSILEWAGYVSSAVDILSPLFNNKVLVNELTKIIKDLQNAITSSILDDNRKLVKGINESINQQLETIIEKTTKEDVSVIEAREEKTKTPVYTEYTDTSATGVQEFSSELDALLDGAI